MKIWTILLAAVLLFSGCMAQRDYETMTDQFVEPVKSAAGEVSLLLPVGAEVVVAEHEQNGSLWLCEEYWICLKTLDSGDLEATLREITGYDPEMLSVISLESGDQKRYECVWTSLGESGDQMNRAVILDDGSYHYALTLHSSAQAAGSLAEQWRNITTTFAVNTGP